MRVLRAELSKLATLPFTWLAAAAGIIIPTGISIITSATSTPGPDTGFAELAVGVLGVIVLGVNVIGNGGATQRAGQLVGNHHHPHRHALRCGHRRRPGCWGHHRRAVDRIVQDPA